MPPPDAPYSQSHTSLRSPYRDGTEGIRSAARWLATAFAGIGGVLVAGVPLTGLGETDVGSLSFWLALASVAVAVGALGYMIFSISRVFTAEFVSLAEFAMSSFPVTTNRWMQTRRSTLLGEISRSINESRDELYGDVAETVATLSKQLAQANDTKRRSDKGKVPGEGPTELEAAAERVRDFANYELARRMFRALLPRLAFAGTIVVIGVAVYAFEIGHAPPAPPSVSSPIPVRLVITSKRILTKLGRTCNSSAIYGVAVAGRLRAPEVVTAGSNGCAALRLKITPSTGVAIPLVLGASADDRRSFYLDAHARYSK
jgi:hypothetical protein